MFNFRSNQLERIRNCERARSGIDRISRRRRSKSPLQFFPTGEPRLIREISHSIVSEIAKKRKKGERKSAGGHKPVNWISRPRIVFTFATGNLLPLSLNALTVEHHLRNANTSFCAVRLRILANERAHVCSQPNSQFANLIIKTR
jgi:hypothetical protein